MAQTNVTGVLSRHAAHHSQSGGPVGNGVRAEAEQNGESILLGYSIELATHIFSLGRVWQNWLRI